MKKFVPVFIFVLLLSQSCKPAITKNQVWSNDKIDAKVKEAIANLDKQVYGYMCDNNYEPLSQLFSDTLLEKINTSFSQKFMPQMQRVIKGKQYKIADQFYIRNIKPVDTVKISAGSGDNAYSIKFLAAANETYVALLVAGDSLNEVMITLVWNNIKGKWKLSSLKGEDYSLNNKNTIDQFQYARTLEENGSLIDAINALALATHCSTPGGNIFSYKNKEAMSRYYDSVTAITKAKYPFPYTVNELTTKPSVFNIHSEVFNAHFVPMILYRSSINVADTVSLKQENEAMQKSIGAIFYGMDKNNKTIIYRAYNELPDGKNNPRYYGYVQTIK